MRCTREYAKGSGYGCDDNERQGHPGTTGENNDRGDDAIDNHRAQGSVMAEPISATIVSMSRTVVCRRAIRQCLRTIPMFTADIGIAPTAESFAWLWNHAS